ncbi:DUF1838 family protein [Rheinheimera salexigens]|uniref:DUF1838 domain-containing protein n=1 Tax=Rheinheimera salexigens TaxID=1628148 RepID=A0A1E7Q7M0_9GAMM|nr:DUF1838 family protein [Rheinheimera salexigens]OEY70146.1 hypothetical protein BI198_11665 [Rheinheimera salexigens]
MRFKKLVLMVALSTLASCSQAEQDKKLDLANSDDSYKAMLRVVGNLDGSAVFKDWDATIMMVLPGEKPKPILRTIGYNAGRMIAKEDGSYEWVTREVSYYVDLQTGEIINQWHNPISNKTVCILDVVNDPVSNAFPSPGSKNNPFAAFTQFDVMGDVAALRWDVPLKYPNALQPKDHPAESTGENYVASEHFIFFADTDDLQQVDSTSTNTHYSWARTGPWLPWMELGQTEGYLIYSGHGNKYHSFAELSSQLKEYTLKHYPEFTDAPTSFYQPNETSWTYYKKQKQAGKLKTNCN